MEEIFCSNKLTRGSKKSGVWHSSGSCHTYIKYRRVRPIALVSAVKDFISVNMISRDRKVSAKIALFGSRSECQIIFAVMK